MVFKASHRAQGKKLSFETLPRRRIYEAIVSQVKEAVFRRALKPGDRLPSEKEMIRMFGVSNMAVREAMRTLEQQGLIQVKKGNRGGCFISEVNHGGLTSFFSLAVVQGKVRLNDLTEIRLLVEPELARLAALKGNEDDVRALEKMHQQAGQLIASGSPVSGASIDFHGTLALASGNHMAVMLVGSFRDLLLGLMSARTESKKAQLEVQRHHARIIEAVKKKDAAKARDEMRQHILWLHSRLGGRLKSQAARLHMNEPEERSVRSSARGI